MTDKQTTPNRSSDEDESWFWGPMSRLGYLWAVISFALDQGHKWWMLNITGITLGDRIEVTSFFDLILVWNKGVSFSLFPQETLAGRLSLGAFSVLAVAALAWWLSRSYQTRANAIGIGLIIGGALGNALDRLIRPGVADFFSLHAFGYNWYIFNVADIAIFAGVVILLYDAIFVGPKTASNSSQG